MQGPGQKCWELWTSANVWLQGLETRIDPHVVGLRINMCGARRIVEHTCLAPHFLGDRMTDSTVGVTWVHAQVDISISGFPRGASPK